MTTAERLISSCINDAKLDMMIAARDIMLFAKKHKALTAKRVGGGGASETTEISFVDKGQAASFRKALKSKWDKDFEKSGEHRGSTTAPIRDGDNWVVEITDYE